MHPKSAAFGVQNDAGPANGRSLQQKLLVPPALGKAFRMKGTAEGL